MIGAQGYPGIFTSPPDDGIYRHEHIGALQPYFVSLSQLEMTFGIARSDDNTADMLNPGTLAMDITTTGAGGRNVDTAEQANKWYSVNIIMNVDTGALAGFLINEDDVGGFTWPAGYTVKRRVGWYRNDASGNFRPLTYYGQGKGAFRVPYYDINKLSLLALTGGNATAFTSVDLSEWLPPTCSCALVRTIYTSAVGTRTASLRIGGSIATNPIPFQYQAGGGSNAFDFLPTSAAQLIEYQVENAADALNIYVWGYQDQI